MQTPSLSNPSFKYTSSAKTDIRKTFARIRREMAEAAKVTKATKNVTPMKRRAAK
jgi:hypothetical protein